MRVLCGLLLSGLGLWGQQQTIIQHLLTNYFAASSYVSPDVINHGNITHLLNAFLGNNGLNVCASPQSMGIGLEASFDNTTWTPFGPQITYITGSVLNATVAANGAFPYFRLHVTSFDNVNCKLSVSYVGAQTQAAVLNQVGGGGGGKQNANFQNIVMTQSTSSTYSYWVGGDALQVTVSGPAGSVVTLTGTDNNSNPVNINLGTTNGQGQLVTTLPAVTVPQVGSWNTNVTVHLSGGGLVILRNVPFVVQATM